MELLAAIASAIDPSYADVALTAAGGFQFWILRKMAAMETSFAEMRVELQHLKEQLKRP